MCEFYTKHPYPPPVENLDRARDMWQDENVHRAEYHLLWPHKEYRPIWMSSWPDVERGKPQSTRSVILLPAWLALMSARQVSSTLRD